MDAVNRLLRIVKESSEKYAAVLCLHGKVEVAVMMTVTMSCDHRVVDGATGSRFLQSLKKFIEEPASMLL